MDEDVGRHEPVLLFEVLRYLDPRPGMVVVDATVGTGGHARAVLERMGGKGVLVGLDVDEEALQRAGGYLEEFGEAVVLYRANFARLDEVLDDLGLEGVDGILFDLGASSLQFDDGARGFSFRRPGRLDMRMDKGRELDAWEVVNRYEEGELARVIRRYGEERWASRIARSIVEQRKRAPIDTTDRLAEIVKGAVPAAARRRGGHPARRTFQALRIEVNNELENLAEALPRACDRLAGKGRMVVISYHSLEDRIVKRFLASRGTRCSCPVEVRGCGCGERGTLRILTHRPVRPSEEEVRRNPRSRSAKLRAAEKR
jgi:16S rRNA (cytosine1402-N4)-methyltransferase